MGSLVVGGQRRMLKRKPMSNLMQLMTSSLHINNNYGPTWTVKVKGTALFALTTPGMTHRRTKMRVLR